MQSNPLFRRARSREAVVARAARRADAGDIAERLACALHDRRPAGCVLMWSIVGSVPTRVDGEGMLIRGGMLREIRASGAGRSEGAGVRINDMVKPARTSASWSAPTTAKRCAAHRQIRSGGARSVGRRGRRSRDDRRPQLRTSSRPDARSTATPSSCRRPRRTCASRQQSFDKGLITRSASWPPSATSCRSRGGSSRCARRSGPLRQDARRRTAHPLALSGGGVASGWISIGLKNTGRSRRAAQSGGRPRHRDQEADRRLGHLRRSGRGRRTGGRGDGAGGLRQLDDRQADRAGHGSAGVALDGEARGIRLHESEDRRRSANIR